MSQIINICLVLVIFHSNSLANCWKYHSECTKSVASPTNIQNVMSETIQSEHEIQHEFSDYYQQRSAAASSSHLKSQEMTNSNSQSNNNNILRLKCPKDGDYIYIGMTQYGVSLSSNTYSKKCLMQEGDCIVSVDYLSNECNGLNSCEIQLDSQYLHSCRNYSDYITIAYECIPKESEISICSDNEIIMDRNQRDLFISTPNYPDEYDNNLKSCKCEISNYERESQSLLSLAFTMLEFDVEEGETSSELYSDSVELCNKDRLEITEQFNNLKEKNSKSLCGQYKEFKEFTAIGNRISLNFSSDDAISRRGFLIKVSSVEDAMCQEGSEYFSSEKCVKLIKNKRLSFNDARKYCNLNNGNLFMINDFTDNMKLNAFLREKNFDSSEIWTQVNTRSDSVPNWVPNLNPNGFASNKNEAQFKSINNNKLCLVKKANSWAYEPCDTAKHFFMCEFNKLIAPVARNQDNNKLFLRKKSSSASINNRARPDSLIKISCGSSIRNEIKDFDRVTSTTSTSNPQSILRDSKKQQAVPALSPTTSLPFILNNLLISESKSKQLNEEQKTEKSSVSSKLSENEARNGSEATIMQSMQNGNYDLALIIGTVSGISIVLIVLNVFCIWNFYDNRLKGYPRKKICEKGSSSASSSSASSDTSRCTNELIYSPETNYLKPNDQYLNSDEQICTNIYMPHVYESIAPSVHYCQTIPSNCSYLIDSYISSNSSEACLIRSGPNGNSLTKQGTLWSAKMPLIQHQTDCSAAPIIILGNGQNYYMNGVSPSSATSSLLSTASSSRPLTTFTSASEAIV